MTQVNMMNGTKEQDKSSTSIGASTASHGTALHQERMIDREREPSANDVDSQKEDDDGLDSDYDSEEDLDGFSIDDDGDNDDDESVSVISSASSMANGSDAESAAMSTHDRDSKSIADREVRTVKCGRYCTYGTLLAVLGILLPFTLYRVASNKFEYSFADDFDGFSDLLGNAWRNYLVETFRALDALSMDLSLMISNDNWPLVTVADFGRLGTQTQFAAKTIRSVLLAPVVSGLVRPSYESYVLVNSNDFIEAAVELNALERNGTLQVEDFALPALNPRIYEFDQDFQIVDVAGPGPFYPIRHMHPFNDSSINYNLISNSYLKAELSANSSEASLNKLLDDHPSSHLLKKILSLDPASSKSDLIATIKYPVRGPNGMTAGVTIASISVLDAFSGILPANVEGVTCIIENMCGQVATVAINRGVATLVGFFDGHDVEYTRFRNSYNLQGIFLEDQTTMQVRLNQNDTEVCPYSIHIYPTARTESSFGSFDSIILAGIGVGTFAFTILVFFIYDRFLERRNRTILLVAIEARAIVSSLFPPNVRDRLFETQRVEQKREKKLKKLNRQLKRKMKKLRKKMVKRRGNKTNLPIDAEAGGKADPEQSQQARQPGLTTKDMRNLLETVQPALGSSLRNLEIKLSGKEKKKLLMHPKHELKNLLAASKILNPSEEFVSMNKPIADLFPHTTVIFADIVGFTAWSSEREPQDVFMLLQTIYHAFDKTAKKRGVFKVETIGDCYVAVTGLPDPQGDHAVRMAKFARECVGKMMEVTKKLEVRLGPDTGDLCLRIGVNSGPVTAGVLQGEKSRFQLFGDTVNTASRMESTGESNMIHCSKSTADLLITAGRAYWVKPRADLVHAKGKGNVQTFWLVNKQEHNFNHPSRSSDDLDNDPNFGQRAPSRSRSIYASYPSRNVKRTTSDSVRVLARSAIDTVATKQESDDMREERLIQWHVELFSRLLVKIAAAREEEPENVAESGKSKVWESVEVIPHSSVMPHPLDKSIVSMSESTDNSDVASAIDSLISGTMGSCAPPPRMPLRGGSIRMIKRENSLKKIQHDAAMSLPQRRGSAQTLDSCDLSIGTFDDLSVDKFITNPETDELDDLDQIVVDEVAEVITIPKLNPQAMRALEHTDTIQLKEEVVSQLKDYIGTIAQMYRNNPFHNFEHASHVTMATNKLLNRIVIPENVDYDRGSDDVFSDLHNFTYGITSDPLTQFSIVFSALVHDVDHTGVPNGQLAKENPDMADLYRNQSLAEQNSVDLAWDLFMDPRYNKLKECIAATEEERKRFRQLLINCVMATDIFDPQMKALRNKRWEKAFHQDASTDETQKGEDDRNTKATIVIEHIIQAADVAHTMQHWHIYQKWNERLFNEMYSAFECGRSQKNPADGWYEGELWFFDNYVIPLAKKLEECQVFGVASDECLNYAQANRNEWFIKGEDAVASMVKRYQKRKFFVTGRAKHRHPSMKPARRMPQK